MRKPAPCSHDNVTRIRPARQVYGTPGIIYARYRCIDCEVEWDDPTERPPEHHLTVYQVHLTTAQDSIVIRNGEHLTGVQGIDIRAELNEHTLVTLTELADVRDL